MDEFPHDRPPHRTSSIALRPPLCWPNDARIAFAVVVSTEYYELQPAPTGFTPANVPGGFGRAPYPDVRAARHPRAAAGEYRGAGTLRGASVGGH